MASSRFQDWRGRDRAPGGARRRGAVLAILVLAPGSILGCGSRIARETVFQAGDTVVRLRAEERDGRPVDRGFSHPVTIAPVRVASILSQIDILPEKADEGDRVPAFPPELIYALGDGISQALARASPSQEVVATAIRVERRLGIFSQKFLTGLVLYAEGEVLQVHLPYVDWEVPKGPEGDELPEPWRGKSPMRFRVLSANGMTPTGAHSVAVVWRDDRFRTPRTLRVGEGGRVLRRTILMESPADAPSETAPETERSLSPQTLRDLADLEESRRRGELTEAEYQARRAEILAADPGSR